MPRLLWHGNLVTVSKAQTAAHVNKTAAPSPKCRMKEQKYLITSNRRIYKLYCLEKDAQSVVFHLKRMAACLD